MSTNTITLVLTITREPDDSFALGLEDEHFGDTDERYVGGLSEGLNFDPATAVEDAAWLVKRYLCEAESQGAAPVIERIIKPMDFKKSGS